MTTTYEVFDSPVGELLIAATPAGLTHLLFARDSDAKFAHAIKPEWIARDAAHEADDALALAHLDRTREQLAGYFGGARRTFDIPLAATGTEFQQSVWKALAHIPYGATWSYGDLARHIEHPRAVRAVGLANGRNPISIIVPCHRVIGANGSLTGYGGGLDRKRFLLTLEGHQP